MNRVVLGALCGALAMLGGLALATNASAGQYGYVADFEALGEGSNFFWDKTPGYRRGGELTSLGAPGAANALFTFREPTVPGKTYPKEMEALFALSALGPLLAEMTVSGHTLGLGGYCQEPCATMTFTYRGADPLVVNGSTYFTGANLLTAGPAVRPDPGASRWTIRDWSSDFLDMSRFTSVWGYGSFNVTSEQVGEDIIGRYNGGYFLAGIPEPSTWAMMIIGFGIAGASLRRRSGAHLTKARSVG